MEEVVQAGHGDHLLICVHDNDSCLWPKLKKSNKIVLDGFV